MINIMVVKATPGPIAVDEKSLLRLVSFSPSVEAGQKIYGVVNNYLVNDAKNPQLQLMLLRYSDIQVDCPYLTVVFEPLEDGDSWTQGIIVDGLKAVVDAFDLKGRVSPDVVQDTFFTEDGSAAVVIRDVAKYITETISSLKRSHIKLVSQKEC